MFDYEPPTPEKLAFLEHSDKGTTCANCGKPAGAHRASEPHSCPPADEPLPVGDHDIIGPRELKLLLLYWPKGPGTAWAAPAEGQTP